MSRLSLPYPNPSLGEMASMPDVETGATNPVDQDARQQQLQPTTRVGGVRQFVLVTSLLIGLLFSTMDTSIVSTSLVTISHDLNDFLNAPWIILSYLLTYMGFAICIAKLSDIYGRRNMAVISWALFIAFSMACAWSQTMTQLIVCRAFQGLGGSGLYSLTQIGLVEVGPVHKPSLIGAMIGFTLVVSFVAGPLLGGVISRLANWRWIFNMNIPFGLAAIIGLVGCWPEEKSSNLFSWTAFRRIDFLGGLTLLCASTTLIFGIQRSGSGMADWNDPATIAALTLAALGWIAFIGWETFVSRRGLATVQPMFPTHLVRQRVYMAGLLVTFLTGFPYVALTVIIPERFQIVNSQDALAAGVHLLPMLGACAVGSFLSGAISSKRNNTGPTLVAASGLQLLGVGLLTLLHDARSDFRYAYGYEAIFGLGVGLSLSAATILTGIHASLKEDMAAAQGAVAQARVLGGCLGISICTVVFSAHTTGKLQASLPPDMLALLRRSPLAVVAFPEAVQSVVRDIYAAAFTMETQVMAYVCGAMFLASLLTLERQPVRLERLTAPSKGRDRHGSDVELSDMGSILST